MSENIFASDAVLLAVWSLLGKYCLHLKISDLDLKSSVRSNVVFSHRSSDLLLYSKKNEVSSKIVKSISNVKPMEYTACDQIKCGLRDDILHLMCPDGYIN